MPDERSNRRRPAIQCEFAARDTRGPAGQPLDAPQGLSEPARSPLEG
jgi:hypothetical protein